MIRTDISKISLLIVVVVVGLSLSGCYGLTPWQRGLHYQTEKADDLDGKKFAKIGVYALSDGSVSGLWGTNSGWYTFGTLPFLVYPVPILPPMITTPNATDLYGFVPGDFPEKLCLPFVIRTDSMNAGPSFELALAMQNHLIERGYDAEAATDFPHRGYVSSEVLLQHAKNNGCDAAFLMVYKLFRQWPISSPTSYMTQYLSNTHQGSHNTGFLFVPSVALVEIATNRILWSSAYYGVVTNAHTMNISNQAFTVAVNEAIVETGREEYVEAAKATVSRIFNPIYWVGSYKPFPSLKQPPAKSSDSYDF